MAKLQFKDLLGPISSAASGAIGLALEGHEDRRQLRQQKKLQDQQIEGQERMGKYNQKMAQEMWDYTNYENQVKHLKGAGLNPGLMYGMGGGGGTTAATAAGTVQGGSAPSGSGREAQDMAGMGIQMGMMDAQRKVLESQARLNNVEADKKGGVDTALGEATIEQIAATIQNTKAQTALTKIQTGIQEVEKQIKEATSMDQIRITDLTAQTMQHELGIIQNNEEISDATKTTAIKTAKQALANMVTEQVLMKSNITVNAEQVKKIAAEIAKIPYEIAIAQQNANTNYQNANTETNRANVEKIFKEAGVSIAEKALLINAGEKIIDILKTFGAGPGTVKGFRR